MDIYALLHQYRVMIPKNQNRYYELYCKSKDSGRWNSDMKPFERKVDLWFLSICVAAKLGLEPIDEIKNARELVRMTVFREEQWRLTVLLAVAIDYNNNISIVSDGTKIMALLNRLAATGLPEVIKRMEGGSSKPIWNLSEGIQLLLLEK